jgi:hypothetical protein
MRQAGARRWQAGRLDGWQHETGQLGAVWVTLRCLLSTAVEAAVWSRRDDGANELSSILVFSASGRRPCAAPPSVEPCTLGVIAAAAADDWMAALQRFVLRSDVHTPAARVCTASDSQRATSIHSRL